MSLFSDYGGGRAERRRVARNLEELSQKSVDALVDFDSWNRSALGRSDVVELFRELGFPNEALEVQRCYKLFVNGKCSVHGNVLFFIGCGHKFCIVCSKRDNFRNFQVQLEQLKELWSALEKAKIVRSFFARNFTLTIGIQARECLTWMFEHGRPVFNDLNDLSIRWFARTYGINMNEYNILAHSSVQSFSSGKMRFSDAKSGLTRAGIVLRRAFAWHVQSFVLALKQDKKTHVISECDNLKRFLTDVELRRARELWFKMVCEYINSCDRFKDWKYLGQAFGKDGEAFFNLEIGVNTEWSMNAGVGLGNRLKYDCRSGSEELGKYIAYGSMLRAYRKLHGREKVKARNWLCFQLGLEGRRPVRSKWYGMFGSAVSKNRVLDYLGLEVKSQLERKKAIAKAHPKKCPDCKGVVEIEKESFIVCLKNGKEKEIIRPKIFNSYMIQARIAKGEIFRVVLNGGYDMLDRLNLRDLHREYREDQMCSFLDDDDYEGLG